MIVLSVNAGSSSLKVAVFDADQLDQARASMSVDGAGPDATCSSTITIDGHTTTRQLPIASPADAIEYVDQWLKHELSIAAEDIVAIGHRVVHGGEAYTQAAILSDEVVDHLVSVTPLAPNHMPATLTAIQAFQSRYPNVQQVACFDTTFFSAIPDVAKTLPIPKSLGLRRYGFHGLSYSALLEDFRQHEGETAANGRVLIAHLGSGASIAALKNGAPIDMSMGFTPVSGIMMSTRSGDIEPGVLTYLHAQKGFSIEDLSDLVTHKSGLLGVSGISPDMHALLEAQSESADAALAVELFCYKAKKQIGAYVAILGGVDSIIFSGGIGERSAEIRRRILSDLGFLGIYIDESRNQANERLISAEHSGVGVHVIPAKEDVSIATQTYAAIKQHSPEPQTQGELS